MGGHTDHYVETDIGVHHKHMRMSSFMAVSAAILARCARDPEDAFAWYQLACRDGIVFG
jgi:hypothetical protein